MDDVHEEGTQTNSNEDYKLRKKNNTTGKLGAKALDIFYWIKKRYRENGKRFWKFVAFFLITKVLSTLVIIWLIKRVLSPHGGHNQDWRKGGSCPASTICSKNIRQPPLILISFDGLRTDYLDRRRNPALEKFMECGTHAPYMFPSFPSKTFPNHYTIVTGLYPESHGIVDNKFIDSANSEKYFHMSTNNSDWYGGEPIWNTVKKNGKKSAVFFWPSSEIKVHGLEPDYLFHYKTDNDTSSEKRIDQAIKWLHMEESDRPSLITLYFNNPDGVNHKQGMHSKVLNLSLDAIDSTVDYLMNQLFLNDLLGCVNIVIVSDHGAQTLNENHQLTAIDEILNSTDPSVPKFELTDGVITHLYLDDKSRIPDLLNLLTNSTASEKYYVYTPDSMPVRYHYSANKRIGDIVLEAKKGGKIFRTKEARDKSRMKSDHGYDNLAVEMRAIFAAFGPSIKERHQIAHFQNIELYSLFTKLLDLSQTAPNNGTNGSLDDVLRREPEAGSRLLPTNFLPATDCSNAKVYKCGGGCQNLACEIEATPSRIPKKSSVDDRNIDPQSFCTVRLCDSTVFIYNQNDEPSIRTFMIENRLSKGPDSKIFFTDSKQNCTMFVEVTQPQGSPKDETAAEGDYCNLHLGPKQITTSPENAGLSEIKLLSGRNNLLIGNSIYVTSEFYRNVWIKFTALVDRYASKYDRLLVYSGPIIGIHGDSSKQSLFFVMLRCDDHKWKPDGRHCENNRSSQAMAFVFPIFERYLNNMSFDEYLLKYAVRVRDVELLTGFDFFSDPDFYPLDLSLQLRTSIVEQLWSA